MEGFRRRNLHYIKMYQTDNNLESLENFELRLAQTIFWCAPRVDIKNPKYCLRTPELRPDIFERNRFSAMDSVTIRRQFYGGNQIRQAKIPKDLGGGRLLVYFPEQNLYDGAAEIETDGFLDVNNLPGWDTWVAFFEHDPEKWDGSYLITWVPPQFVKTVSNGIYVNPEECIIWLADSNLAIAQTLQRKGLLV